MADSFGARLRQRREDQHIDLIAIAAQTKIKVSLLEALERDDVSHWPPGIFRRAYIRAYGHAIGLDPDAVAREFLDAHPEPAEVVTTEALAAAVEGPRRGGAPTRLSYLVGSAIGSLSRLRRSPSTEHVEQLVGSDGGWVDLSSKPAPRSPAAPRSFSATASEPVAAPVPQPAPAVAPVAEPGPIRQTDVVIPDAGPVEGQGSTDPDLLAVAQLCTELGRVESPDEIRPLLQEAARILDAPGLILWLWDATAAGLRPALAYGYSDKVLVQVPTVGRDADNATAAAFRSAQPCVMKGDDRTSGALVVPLLARGGCTGVLAIELPNGTEQSVSVRAVATIIGALLAQLTGPSEASDVPIEPEVADPAAGDATASMRRTAGQR